MCFECLYSGKTKTKICSNCKKELSLSDFYKDKDKYDGYKTICKDCSKKYYKKKYHEDKRKEGRLYYKNRKKRRVKNWLLKEGKYYRYKNRGFKQPNDEAVIMKVTSVRETEKSCIFSFIQIYPEEKPEIEWTEAKHNLHWSWLYQELTKKEVENRLKQQKGKN